MRPCDFYNGNESSVLESVLCACDSHESSLYLGIQSRMRADLPRLAAACRDNLLVKAQPHATAFRRRT